MRLAASNELVLDTEPEELVFTQLQDMFFFGHHKLFEIEDVLPIEGCTTLLENAANFRLGLEVSVLHQFGG